MNNRHLPRFLGSRLHSEPCQIPIITLDPHPGLGPDPDPDLYPGLDRINIPIMLN